MIKNWFILKQITEALVEDELSDYCFQAFESEVGESYKILTVMNE